MKKITWQEMTNLKDAQIRPFTANFQLDTPSDEEGNIGFGTFVVLRFQGNFPVVNSDGIEWVAVNADTVYCEMV